ncbi:hypothetical protein [Sediminibacterium goheungense]|uniref:Uncharacterized protein n=1 Tax=Sediminibacterium goheungense TaxID=1086393 RepID=A0A4R6IV91_9BACT|nr:hypothetical protein [Sediminibacterium goheungense]TDO26559.1 hypothetical protein BC659_1866 [Sediminibacterium goheungense]
MKNIDFYKVVTVVLLGIIAWSLFTTANKKEGGSVRFVQNGQLILDTQNGSVYEIDGYGNDPKLISKKIAK